MARLPDELYIEIFKLTGENPLKFRVCRHFQRIIFDLYPFSGALSVKVCEMIIYSKRNDLLKSFRGLRNYPDLLFYPVVCASRYCNTEALSALLSVGFDPSIDDNFAIQLASEKGNTEILRILLADSRVDPAVKHNFPISLASANGHIDAVKVLLSDIRVDPSDNRNDAICSSVYWGRIELVRLLLSDKRVDPSDNSNYAIVMASRSGHTEIVKILLADPRCDPSALGNTAIKLAFANGHTEVVKLLLEDPRVYNTFDVTQFLKNTCAKIPEKLFFPGK